MYLANLILGGYNIVLTLILMLYQLTGKRLHIKMNIYFVWMCVCNIVMTLGDMAGWAFEGQQNSWYPIAMWGTLLFFISSAPLLLAYIYYFREHMSEVVKVPAWVFRLVLVLTIIHVVGIVVAHPFGWFYYFDENNIYCRGDFFLLSQLIPLLIYLIGCILLVVYRKLLRRKVFICALAFIGLPAIAEIIQILNLGIALINSAITITLLLIFVYIQSERELLVQKQAQELTEANVDIMLSQINPHFLYNSLTTIRQLCEIDPKVAKDSIRDFSIFLRGNMNSLTNKAPIPFSQELEHVEHYLKLEKQRFRERLNIVYDIEIEDFSISPLSMQPLVENSVRHGITKKEEGGTITISTREKEDCYVLVISDDGAGFNTNDSLSEGSEPHIGIANVRSRLKSTCGGTLTVESIVDKGTTATISIPKQEDRP